MGYDTLDLVKSELHTAFNKSDAASEECINSEPDSANLSMEEIIPAIVPDPQAQSSQTSKEDIKETDENEEALENEELKKLTTKKEYR